jgi:hypothetical protein
MHELCNQSCRPAMVLRVVTATWPAVVALHVAFIGISQVSDMLQD